MKSVKDLKKKNILLEQPVLVNIEDKEYFVNEIKCLPNEYYAIDIDGIVVISKGEKNPEWQVFIYDEDKSLSYPVLVEIHDYKDKQKSYFINTSKVDYNSFYNFSKANEAVLVTISNITSMQSSVNIELLGESESEWVNTGDHIHIEEFTDFVKPIKIDVNQEAIDKEIDKLLGYMKEKNKTIAYYPTTFYDEINQPVALPTPFEATADPFKNYQSLQESTNSMEIKLDDVGPRNRTLAIVYGSAQSPSDFRERASRLIGSLNMPDTIKVVVVTANGNKVFSGLDFTQPKLDGELDPDILDHVKKRFVQVLEVRNGGNI